MAQFVDTTLLDFYRPMTSPAADLLPCSWAEIWRKRGTLAIDPDPFMSDHNFDLELVGKLPLTGGYVFHATISETGHELFVAAVSLPPGVDIEDVDDPFRFVRAEFAEWRDLNVLGSSYAAPNVQRRVH